MMSLLDNSNFYYITMALQALCVWHCIKKGNQQKWIWIIIILPIVGCLIYFFSEIVTGNDMNRVSNGLGSALNPGGRVRKLEQQLKFADTFGNRIALADEYLLTNQTEKAIEIYENSLVGMFAENEHGVMQLMTAYGKTGQHEEILPLAKKVYQSPQFLRSPAHIAYAKALGHTGNTAAAEKEFQRMKSRFSAFESRYHYGLFLLQTERTNDAKEVFAEILDEEKHLSHNEKRFHRAWFAKSKDELRKIA